MVTRSTLLALASLITTALGGPASERVGSFKLDGATWTIFRSLESKGRLFFQSSSGAVTWNDPRKILAAEATRGTGFIVFVITLLVLVAIAAAWVAYLVIKYPSYFKGKKKGKGLKFSPINSPGRPAAGDRPSNVSPVKKSG